MPMGFFSALRVALSALVVNKGRSTLTSLGIVIGISAVIALVSAGDGARLLLDEKLETVGKNIIVVRMGGKSSQGQVTSFSPLKHEDADVIRKHLGSKLVGVAALQQFPGNVTARNSPPCGTTFVGCTPELQRVRKWTLDAGQFISDEDVKAAARVCLVGHTVLKKIFPDNPRPLGKTLYANRQSLKIIGVLTEKGKNPLGQDQDNQIFIPLTTLEQLISARHILTQIVTAPKDPDQGEQVRAEITRLVRETHHVKPGSEDFDVFSVHEMAQLATIVTRTLQILIAVIASISLVVGGI